MRLKRILASPYSGGVGGLVSVAWEAFWLVGPPIGIVDATAQKQYLFWGFIALVISFLWVFITQQIKIHKYETPNLDILFDENDDAYIYPFQFDIAGIIHDSLLFKVGIVSTTSDLVRLEIPGMFLGGRKSTDLYLHIADDQTNQKRETHLNANSDPVFWDVIVTNRTRYSKLVSDGDRFFLQHIKPNTTQELTREKYEFEITASGRNSHTPRRKVVRFFIDEEGKPRMELSDPASR